MKCPPLWNNRAEAGELLAQAIEFGTMDPGAIIVLALPRGGVPVAVPIARRFALPLQTWSVGKITSSEYPEFAIGAVAPLSVVIWSNIVTKNLQWNDRQRKKAADQAIYEMKRRIKIFGDPQPESLCGTNVLIVDDGVATGLTVRAAIESLRRAGVMRIGLAVPIIEHNVSLEIERKVDFVFALARVSKMSAVGLWYRDFQQLSDADVLNAMAAFRKMSVSIPSCHFDFES